MGLSPSPRGGDPQYSQPLGPMQCESLLRSGGDPLLKPSQECQPIPGVGPKGARETSGLTL